MTRSTIIANHASNFISALDAPLLRLSPKDYWTLEDALRHVQIFGGTGSGKSSGSAKMIAEAFLKSGFGGLVLCAKPDEADRWRRYAQTTGREDSFLFVSPDSPWHFNFLDYILCKDGIEAANNAVDVLMRIAEASRLAKDRPSNSGAQFFEDATRQLLSNAVPVLFSAYGHMNLADFYRFLATAPRSAKQAEDPAWQRESYFFATMKACFTAPIHALPSHELSIIASYWRHDFAELDPETKSNIVITITSLLTRFLKGRLHSLFCTKTSFVPDLAFQGTVIVLDMPVKTYDTDGIIAAQLVKYLFQRTVESRDTRGQAVRPIFLWADESQFFVNSYDAEFLSTARSARASTVYITQSLPTYTAKIGGSNPQAYANMLLGNFITKIFHSNGCNETNQWASQSIGQRLVLRRTKSASYSSGHNVGWNEGENQGLSSSGSGNSSYDRHSYRFTHATSRSTSSGENRGLSGGRSESEQEGESYAEQKDWKVPPEIFAGDLRTGGAAHNFEVDAVWFQSDRPFRNTDHTWLFTSFPQK